MALAPMPQPYQAFLEYVESTDQWRDADKHWMEMMLGESLEAYDTDGPHFAAVILDYTLKIREVIQRNHPMGPHADTGDCALVFELSVLTTHMSIMAAIATREYRGKSPVWQLPRPPVEGISE